MSEENVRRIGAYRVETLRPGVFAIDDDQQESMYLICGEKRALLIDTGSNPEPLMPMLRQLWQGEIVLALTHAHFDHMYHCDEFASVSVGAEDIRAWNKSLRLVVFLGTVGSGKKAKHYPIKRYHPLRTGDTIDLGGKVLRVLEAKGHSPGSLIFIDEADACLFIGDAFGWMWMPGCSVLSDYIESLNALIPALKPYDGYLVLEGHRLQNTPAGVALEDMPSARQDAENMRDLCAKILAGELRPVKQERFFGFQTAEYADCGTHVVIRKSKLK